ncbi:MAG: hypothetical protein MOGMAGMI_00355 [Candidatus Omnitrophica bacterium]|nr:hypothetical protein [Candidatus Omnitrophota bacterium]
MDISKLDEKQFAIVFSKIHKKITEDPLTNFFEAKGFLNFQPTPAQRVALKTLFKLPLDENTKHSVRMEHTNPDGSFDLIDTEMTELELFTYMTGRDWKDLGDQWITRLNLVCGRRSGKSLIAGAIATFSAIKVNWRPYLKKTRTASVVVLSHSVEFSQEILDVIRGFFEDSPILSRLIDKDNKNTQRTFNLKVPFIEDGEIVYSRVTIKVGAASKKTTRGLAICTLLADEIAFWNLQENSAEKDEDIIRAVRPSLLQFKDQGLFMKLSSPGIKSGVLYNEYQKWVEGTLPKNYVVFKSPSWVWNNILGKSEFIEEYQIDPTSFDNEIRANFVDSISNFILPEFVDLAVNRGITFLPPEKENPEMRYYAAIDAAFKGDRFTFSVVGYDGNTVKQFISKGWEGTRQVPVKASEVALYIREICKEYDIPKVAADQYSFNPLRELFEQHGVVLVENVFNLNYKKKIFFNLKKLIHDRKIELLDNPLQTKEIKELIVNQTNAGTVRISHPPGGHDDFADSLAIACLITAENEGRNLKDDFQSTLDDSIGGATSIKSLMISGKLDADFSDNSSMFIQDPVTKKLVPREEIADELDDGIGGYF